MNKKLKKDGTVSHQGEGGGKPPIFKNEEELVNAIGKYFKRIDELPPLIKEIPSKVGLRTELGLTKDLYSDYKKRYPYPIKKAENVIEKAWVERLAGPNATGAIFYLKNAFFEDYKDRAYTDITSGGKPIPLLNYVRHHYSNKKNTETPKEN